MDDLFKEFFYDGIAKIIPGIAALFLYGAYFGMTSNNHDSPIFVNSCVVLVAWVVGTVIEFLSFIPAIPINKIFTNRKNNRTPATKPTKFDESLDWLLPTCKVLTGEDKKEETRKITKLYAEAVMFRSLVVIFIVAILICPRPLWDIGWEWYYGVIGCILFGSIWFYTKSKINDFIKSKINNLKSIIFRA